MMVNAVASGFGELSEIIGDAGLDLEAMCRFTPLGKVLVVARERHGLSVRDAARRSGLLQKTVRAIECEGLKDIVPGLIERYATFLGVGRYLAAWRGANPKLAAEWDAVPVPKLPALKECLPEPALTEEDFAEEVVEEDFPMALAEAAEAALRVDHDEPALWQMKVTLHYTQPPVWRRIVVPNTMSLADLHTVIQVAMGWTDSHLHAFTLGDRRTGMRFGVPSPADWSEVLDEADYTLGSLDLRPRGKLHYEYDFGDGWEHDIELEKVLPHVAGALPHCPDGQRACPPDDCGGPPGYERFCEVARDPKHPEYRELILDWYGGAYNPEAFDSAEVDRMLAAMFKPRPRRKRRENPSRRPRRRWGL